MGEEGRGHTTPLQNSHMPSSTYTRTHEKKDGEMPVSARFYFSHFRVGRSFAAASLPFFLFLLLPSFCLRG